MKEYPDFPEDTRYIVSDTDLKLHDLSHQKAECRIDHIIEANIIEVFADPDQANMLGYERCRYCFAPVCGPWPGTAVMNADRPAAGING